jgi:hypothetical protein
MLRVLDAPIIRYAGATELPLRITKVVPRQQMQYIFQPRDDARVQTMFPPSLRKHSVRLTLRHNGGIVFSWSGKSPVAG